MALTYVFEVKDNGSATFQKINANVNVLNQSLIKVDNSTNIVNKSLGLLKTSVATALGSGIAHGVTLLKDLGKQMVENYDSAAKLSQNIGITAESVLGLRHAAELSHVGAEAMDKNMQKLSKTMFDAASGNKAAGKSFEQLGISVTNSDGSLKKSDAVLMELADKFKALPPGTERAAAAMDIFGKSGASMVSMLKDGSGALKKMVDEGAGAAGNVQSISEAMEKLNDAGTRAKAALMGMLAGIVDSAPFKAMISGFNSMSEALIKWNKESKDAAAAEKQANLALLEKYHLQMAIIGNRDEALKTDFQQKKLIGEQIAALHDKLKLDEDELKLLRAKAQVRALESKEANGGLWDDEYEKMEKYKKQIEDIEKKRADAAKTTSILPKTTNDDAAKKYEAETKRLQDWLDSYEKSKRTESEIAADNYKKELENFDKTLLSIYAKVKELFPCLWVNVKDGVRVNNWCGLRSPACTIGAPNSAHRKGKALDLHYSNLKALRFWCTSSEGLAAGILRVEAAIKTPTWVHIDVMQPNEDIWKDKTIPYIFIP